jgi:hypothetical protein
MSILQFHISIRKTKPLIWRRIWIRDTMTFREFHFAIQIIFDWTHSHLWEFSDDEIKVGDLHLLDELGIQPDHLLKLKNVFRKRGQTMTYLYDFGDFWEHTIVLEDKMEPIPKMKYPILVDGEWTAPPEDCGGIPGYYDMVKILKNPDHPEYQEYKTWLGNKNPREKRLFRYDYNMQLKNLRAFIRKVDM